MSVCPHFGSCGGCSKQDVSYQTQLDQKEKFVRDCLGEFIVESWKPILASPETEFYRNKMEYSFGNEVDIQIFSGTGGRMSGARSGLAQVASPEHPSTYSGALLQEKHTVHIGLHPRKRFALVMPTPECQLLSPEAQKIQSIVTDWANEFEIPSFTRKTAAGDLRHLVIREGKNTGERMVKLVAKSSTSHVDILAERLKTSNVPITTFFWSVHDGLSDVAHGAENKIFWGDGAIAERIGKIKVRVTPNSFLQTNTRAAEQMLNVLGGWMEKLPTPRKIYDLYCGSGTIGLNLAVDNMHLVGIETNPSAIEEARATAKENSLHDAEFIVGPVEKIIATRSLVDDHDQALIVVDPPRPGLHPSVVEALNTAAAPNLFYVSCNPESLARDLRGLVSRYTIREVQPMDFFPHTDHIETAVWLARK
jgi:23S rRNA (uracil1939-C5)-methyltransferase